MKQAASLLWLSAILFSCNSNEAMQTTESGLQYKIHRLKKDGKKAPMMATAKVSVTPFRNDTALYDEGRMPLYQMVMPPAPFVTDPLAEIMVTVGIQEGDSIITITKKNVKTAFKINKVFIPGENGQNSDSLMMVDKNEELHRFTSSRAAMEEKRIQDYLQKNNITASKTTESIYMEIVDKGTAPLADSGKTAGIKFTVRGLYNNKIINTNTDPKFRQPPVLEFQTGKGMMLKQVDAVVQQLGKGGKAKIYIPAAVALGAKAAEPGADLSQDICFEVELVSVK